MYYLQYFGLTHDPLGNHVILPLTQYADLEKKLNFLLQTKGIGLITGSSGTGKTTALRRWSKTLNPLTHQTIYQSDNHFSAFDIYSQLAESLGLEKCHRCCKLWRCLKEGLLEMYDQKQLSTIWVLDEAHKLSTNFLLELPSFLNFSFDSRPILTIILCGTSSIQSILRRAAYDATASRIHFSFEWKAIDDKAQFSKIIDQAFTNAGKTEKIMADSAIDLMCIASKGRLRYASRIITQALIIATEKNINHLSDEVIQQAIEGLQI